MAKSYEPDPRRFKVIFILSMIFLSVMAVVIIRKKMAKERLDPPQKIQLY